MFITSFYMFILVHLSEVHLEEYQRGPRSPYFTHFKKSWNILLIYVLIPLSVIFTLLHETICILQ